VQKAIERAEAAKRDAQSMSEEELATVESALTRSLAQLRVKRRNQK
jgi:hypothetical protein